MKIVEFPEQNVVIAKDQPQYQPLPAFQFGDRFFGAAPATFFREDLAPNSDFQSAIATAIADH